MSSPGTLRVGCRRRPRPARPAGRLGSFGLAAEGDGGRRRRGGPVERRAPPSPGQARPPEQRRHADATRGPGAILAAAAKRVHSAAVLGRPTIAARNRLMRRRLAAAGHLDGVVQRSSDMLLPPSCRVVTLGGLDGAAGPTRIPLATPAGALRARYPALRGSPAQGLRVRGRLLRCHPLGRREHHRGLRYPGRARLHGGSRPEPRAARAGSAATGAGRATCSSANAGRTRTARRCSRRSRRVRERYPDARLDVVGDHPRLDAAGCRRPRAALAARTPPTRSCMAALYRSATAS